MILYFPEKFDENEWTILIALVANILIFLFLPKKLPKEITPLIVLLSISFPKIMDHTMAVKPYNLYDITDTNKYELFDLLLYGVYPAFGYVFIYFIDHFKRVMFVLYLVGWSLFATLFEWIFVKLHVYTYTGWRIVYSLPIYIVVLSLTFLFYRFLMNYRFKGRQTQ